MPSPLQAFLVFRITSAISILLVEAKGYCKPSYNEQDTRPPFPPIQTSKNHGIQIVNSVKVEPARTLPEGCVSSVILKRRIQISHCLPRSPDPSLW